MTNFSEEKIEDIKKKYKGQFLEYNDSRISQIVEGYILQTIFYYETGEVSWEFGPGELSGQHNPTLLETGNILVYDNRNAGTGSRVAEIFPETGEIVWEYEAEGFYSGHISGAQRLLNGNTLICEGAEGRIFEVDPEGNIVWEHFSPDDAQVFRATRYEVEEIAWPDLTIFE